ncbi:MAG: DUF1847 domain-containing protein [Bacteroidales bacterium]|jgi:uncharacterized metal-binding protein|nr:DUF1847 domain-containing protein [Bacteroidales bacterium]
MGEESFGPLYSESDRKIMKVAEDSLDPQLDRVHEIIAYARKAGLKKIGIANCTAFTREADMLREMLCNEGFTVETVNCKLGKVKLDEIIPGYSGISCNPAGQAKYLEERGTELNIMMGLCLGHDMIFTSKSKAPVTPLVVKDRKLKHNTLGAFQKP